MATIREGTCGKVAMYWWQSSIVQSVPAPPSLRLCRSSKSTQFTPAVPFNGFKRSIALVEGKKGRGTAFVVRSGLLATNNHVIQDESIDQVRVRFVSVDNPTANALPVKLLYRDRARDLALLAVDKQEAMVHSAV